MHRNMFSLKEKEVQEGHVGLTMNTYRTITYGNWVTQTDTFANDYCAGEVLAYGCFFARYKYI